MTKVHLLFVHWIHFLIGVIETNEIMLPKLCVDVDLIKLIDFPYGLKCLQITLNTDHQRSCVSKLLGSGDVTFQIRSQMFLQQRNISTEVEGQCETFLIFTKSLDIMKKIFQPEQNNAKIFFPFTKIYFYLSDSHSDNIKNMESMTLAKSSLISNAIFGYLLEHINGKHGSKLVIRDLSTNGIRRLNPAYMPSDFLHPTFDPSLINNFTISLFNCKPSTFYPEDGDDKTIINVMDGVEFRLVKEVTKNWKKIYNFRDFSRTKLPPWKTIVADVMNKTSDLAMCNIWLIEQSKDFDSTTFLSEKCSTFLVPKPLKLNEATALYTSMNTSVWLIFLLFLLLSSVLLNINSRMEKRLFQRNSVFTDLSRALLETVNTATSHSVDRFSSEQTSAKILLTSWILLCWCIAISYTTIYTSRLASPSHETPVNTMRQFLDYGLSICNPYLNADAMEQIRRSGSAELSARSIVYGEDKQYRRRLFRQRVCGLFANRLHGNYISSADFSKDDYDLLPMFRIMKDCYYRFYTVLVFKKYSPFTKLFNWYIRRYQEAGIIKKWYLDFSMYQKQVKSLREDYPEERGSPKIIKLIDVSGAFFLLGVGLAFSFAAFSVELVKHRRFGREWLTFNSTVL